MEIGLTGCDTDLDRSLCYVEAIVSTAARIGTHPEHPHISPPLERLWALSLNFGRRIRCPGLQTVVRLLASHPFHSFVGKGIRDAACEPTSPPFEFPLKFLRLEKSNLSPTSLRNFLLCLPMLNEVSISTTSTSKNRARTVSYRGNSDGL
jgi:hypothetical protein